MRSRGRNLRPLGRGGRQSGKKKNTRHPAGLMVLPEVFPSRRKYEAPDGRPGALWADAGLTSDPAAGQGAG